MHNQDDPRIIVLALAASGALAGLAQLLLSSENIEPIRQPAPINCHWSMCPIKNGNNRAAIDNIAG